MAVRQRPLKIELGELWSTDIRGRALAFAMLAVILAVTAASEDENRNGAKVRKMPMLSSVR